MVSCGSTETISKKYPTIGYLEKLSPEFSEIISENTKIEIIVSDHNWTEGPVWSPEEQCLIYSEVPKNIAYK